MLDMSAALAPPASMARCAEIDARLPCCSMLTIAAVTGSFPARPDMSGGRHGYSAQHRPTTSGAYLHPSLSRQLG